MSQVRKAAKQIEAANLCNLLLLRRIFVLSGTLSFALGIHRLGLLSHMKQSWPGDPSALLKMSSLKNVLWINIISFWLIDGLSDLLMTGSNISSQCLVSSWWTRDGSITKPFLTAPHSHQDNLVTLLCDLTEHYAPLNHNISLTRLKWSVSKSVSSQKKLFQDVELVFFLVPPVPLASQFCHNFCWYVLYKHMPFENY